MNAKLKGTGPVVPYVAYISGEPLLKLYGFRIDGEVEQQGMGSCLYLDTQEVFQPPEGDVVFCCLLGDLVSQALRKGFHLGIELRERRGTFRDLLGHRLDGSGRGSTAPPSPR